MRASSYSRDVFACAVVQTLSGALTVTAGTVSIGALSASPTVALTQTYAVSAGATVRLVQAGASTGAVTITGPYNGFSGAGSFRTCARAALLFAALFFFFFSRSRLSTKSCLLWG
jgi:hypothetical protein